MWKKKLTLTAAAMLIALLLAEIALRVLGIGASGRGSSWFAGGNHPRFLFQPDAASGYALRPGFQGQEIARGKEFDVAVAVDGQGLRAQPHAAPATPGVLTIGDSMTFGEGVPGDATFSAVLEKALGVRVVNAGVPGYSSTQMLGRLRRYLPVFHPRVVVMTLSPTWDQDRCALPFVYRDGYIVAREYADRLVLIGGNLYLRETRLPVLGTMTAYAEGHSNLARLALPALAGAARQALLHPPPDKPSEAADLEPTARNLQQAYQLASRSGAAFLAVMIDDRGADYRHDRHLLQARLRELGVPWVAADNQLLPKGRWKKLRYPIDTHWNAEGHREVGEALAPRLQPLLAGSPGQEPSGSPQESS